MPCAAAPSRFPHVNLPGSFGFEDDGGQHVKVRGAPGRRPRDVRAESVVAPDLSEDSQLLVDDAKDGLRRLEQRRSLKSWQTDAAMLVLRKESRHLLSGGVMQQGGILSACKRAGGGSNLDLYAFSRMISAWSQEHERASVHQRKRKKKSKMKSMSGALGGALGRKSGEGLPR